MLCRENCPLNKIDCKPLSNVVADDNSSLVCIGSSAPESRSLMQDKFRHCFVNSETSTCYDYDAYDLKSVISVMSEGLLLEELGAAN